MTMKTLRVGVSEKGGTFWSQAATIARHLVGRGRYECELVEAEQASIDNARKLGTRHIDLGFMASNWIGRAKNAVAPFDYEIDLCMVSPANSGAMFFITREDSNLRRIRDLVGKRVSVGPDGSGMVQHIHTLFGALGIGFDEFEPLYLSFEEGGRALESGEVDAQWQCPYPNAVMRDLSERLDVRVLEYDEGELDQILEAVSFYRRGCLMPGTFRGVSKQSWQIAVVNVIAAHSGTDDQIVYEWIMAMIDNLDTLALDNPLFAGLEQLFEPLRKTGATALEFGGVPLHSGALQAYRESGYLN